MNNKKVSVEAKTSGGVFERVDDVVVIISAKNGVTTQRPLYSRGKTLYAGIGSGFISLSRSKGTSSTSHKWVEIVPTNNCIFDYIEPHFGFLELP